MTTETRTKPISLVIVDDNAGIRRLLGALAKRDEGLVVVGEAADGREAVRAVEEHHPDIVILDIMMPVMDGLEAIPPILERSPQTRIVMYSAYAESRDEAMELGAHGWCLKGEPWNALSEIIRDLIAERDSDQGT